MEKIININLEKLVNEKNNGKISAEIALINIKDIISNLDGVKKEHRRKKKFERYTRILNIIIENKNNKNLTCGYVARKIGLKKSYIIDSIRTLYVYSKTKKEIEKIGVKSNYGKSTKTRFRYLMVVHKISYPKTR